MNLLRWAWTLLLLSLLVPLLLIGLTGLLGAVLPDLDAINHFRPWWALAGLAGLLGVFLARCGWRRPLGILALVVLLLQLPFTLPTWLRGLDQAQAGQLPGQDLVLVTANIYYGSREVTGTLAYLKRVKPDLVFLQEVSPRSLASLHEALADELPHAVHCVDRRYCNLAILSRFPLSQAAAAYLGWRAETTPVVPLAGWDLAETALPDRRKAAAGLTAEVALDRGQRLRLFNVHLSWPLPAAIQRRQFRWVAERLADFPPGPRLLAGDFNATPWSFGLAGFESDLPLTRITQGNFSWPAGRRLPFPVVPIDQIYAGPAFQVLSVERGPEVGSDHYPILARLRLAPAGSAE
ncbi:MAG: endonuclease/exonuclease/phosphatase family protein [Rhodospirillales bacterium]